jgi:hypothetical protein
MDPKVEDYTSRKFVLALLSVVLASVAFFFTNKLPVLYWLIYMFAIVLGYQGVNLLEALLATKTSEVKP